MRAVSRLVRPSDRKAVLDALKRVCRQENATLARQELSTFLNSYGRKYKRLHKLFQNDASLFSFRWNDSPAWSTAITTDGSLGKLIADFRKHIRNDWRCSRIEFSACTIKVYT